MRAPVYTNRLQCAECGRVSREGERGWTAYLTAEDDGSEAVAVFCPDCGEREFDV
jgi:ribosomal protein S27AE